MSAGSNNNPNIFASNNSRLRSRVTTENKNKNKDSKVQAADKPPEDRLDATKSALLARRKGIKNSMNFFNSGPLDNYFIDLYKFLNNPNIKQKVKHEVASSAGHKKWLREGLDDFLAGTYKNKQYEEKIKGVPHMGLLVRQIGFGQVTLVNSELTPKIDLILAKVVEVMIRELGTNAWMAAKIMRRVLRQGAFYPSLYMSQIGEQVLKPNPEKIIRYFCSSDQQIVRQDSAQFQNLLARCFEVYFEEYTKCVISLSEFLDVRLGDSNERPMGLILWDNYYQIIEDLLKVREKDNRDSFQLIQAKHKYQEFVLIRKIRLFCYFIRFYLESVNQDINLVVEVAGHQDKLYEKYISKIDDNMIQIESSDRFTTSQVSELQKMLTELLLILVPWRQFEQEHFSRRGDSRSMNYLIEAVAKTKSQPLRPMRVLLAKDGDFSKDVLMVIDKEIAKGSWPVHGFQWKGWLGVLLKKLKTNNQVSLDRYPHLLRLTIWLCKTIVKEETQLFWDMVQTLMSELRSAPDTSDKFYMRQIASFVVDNLQEQNGARGILGMTYILPILTASLGSALQERAYLTNFFQLIEVETFKANIIDQIVSALNLEERPSERPMKIHYSLEEKDRKIEQELKLLCKMVQIIGGELFLLEQFIDGKQTNGLSVVVFLCRIFAKISPQNIHDIKCLRYLVQTLDSIFVCTQTRNLLPLALGLIQSGKVSCGRVIKQIVDLCAQDEGNSQFDRQCTKLRKAFTEHILNVLRMSNSIGDYFPTTCRREDQKSYEQLERYMKHGRFDEVRQHFLTDDKPPLKVVPWLHSFLLILESPRLTMLDLEVVRQLLLKCRISKMSSRECNNLEVIISILNNSRIHQQICDILTPDLKNEQKKYLFDLANKKYTGMLIQTDPIVDANGKSMTQQPKYGSKQYRLRKSKKRIDEKKQCIYGQISSALRVIETIMRLNMEGPFDLLQQCQLNSWCLDSIAGKGHFFTVPFTLQLDQVDKETKPTRKNRVTKSVEHQMTASINLLHTIASLLGFQHRQGINTKLHPSYQSQVKGVISFSAPLDSNTKVDSEVILMSQLSLLNQWPQNDSITVSVLQILSHTLSLGLEKYTYMSITNRLYPNHKNLQNSATTNKILNDLFKVFLSILTGQSLRQKEVCLQFMCLCLKTNKFAQFIRLQVLQFREPFMSCLDDLENENSMQMQMSLMLFFNQLLADDPTSDDIRFVKMCFGDILRFGDRLALLCRSKFSTVKEYDEQIVGHETTLIWVRNAKSLVLCKMTLLLYAAILSALLANESAFIAQQICRWLLTNFELYTSPVPSLSLEELETLKVDSSRMLTEICQRQTEIGFHEFSADIHKLLLTEIQGAMGDDFACRRWDVYHRAIENEQNPQTTTLKAFRMSLRYSLQMSQQFLSQTYYTILLGQFQKGSSGYYFLSTEQNSKHLIQVISQGQRAPNCHSGQQLLTRHDIFSKNIFMMIRNIIKDVWSNFDEGSLVFRKDCAILTLAELLKSAAKMLNSDYKTNGGYTVEAMKIIDILEADQINSRRERVGQQAYLVLLQAQTTLIQALYVTSRLRNLNQETISNYFMCLSRLLSNSFPQLTKLSILQLEQVVYNVQIINLIALDQDSKEYLMSEQRNDLFGLLSRGLQIALQTLSDKHSDEQMKCVSLELFRKAVQVDNLAVSVNQKHASKHKLLTLLENIVMTQGDSEMLTSLFVADFIAEAAVNCASGWVRLISRLLTMNDGLILNRMSKCGTLQSLWSIIESKLYYSALLDLNFQESWRNPEIGKTLESLLVGIQNHVQRFEQNRVLPSSQAQSELLRKTIEQSRSKYNPAVQKNLFSIVVELRMFEMLKNFLLFFLTAIRNSPLIIQFCQKTIVNSPLEEQTWERLRLTLEYCCDFLARFAITLSKDKGIIVAANRAIINQATFSPFYLRIFFEEYTNQNDLLEDTMDSVLVLVQCVKVFMTTWKNFDWKSRIDWQTSRASLFRKVNSTLQKFGQLSLRLGCESVLKERSSELSTMLTEADITDDL